jgi:hypothetical protein
MVRGDDLSFVWVDASDVDFHIVLVIKSFYRILSYVNYLLSGFRLTNYNLFVIIKALN